MAELFGFDAFSPKEIAERVETVGVAKARLPLLSTIVLGVMAGAFIGFGALGFVLVKSDPTLGFAAGQVVGGLAFSLGLILVVVAGAELFTGNNLLVMARADGKISTGELCATGRSSARRISWGRRGSPRSSSCRGTRT